MMPFNLTFLKLKIKTEESETNPKTKKVSLALFSNNSTSHYMYFSPHFDIHFQIPYGILLRTINRFISTCMQQTNKVEKVT